MTDQTQDQTVDAMFDEADWKVEMTFHVDDAMLKSIADTVQYLLDRFNIDEFVKTGGRSLDGWVADAKNLAHWKFAPMGLGFDGAYDSSNLTIDRKKAFKWGWQSMVYVSMLQALLQSTFENLYAYRDRISHIGIIPEEASNDLQEELHSVLAEAIKGMRDQASPASMVERIDESIRNRELRPDSFDDWGE